MKALLLLFLLSTASFAQEFFPKGCFAPTQDSHQFKVQWYSSQLKALQEAPLYAEKIDAKTECYRFTWLRTFHHPVVFRVDVQADGTAQFTIKVADGAGGYEPGKLVRNEKRAWDERMVKMIRSRFLGEKFFEIPAFEEGRLGCDGSEWILECVRDGKYHIVSRWSPESGPVHTLGFQLIEIAIAGDFTPIY
jgi:hypothetical protein